MTQETVFSFITKMANQAGIPEKEQFSEDDVLDKISEDLLELEITFLPKPEEK